MKRGLITESHVLIYCDGCGDVYADHHGHPVCFQTTHQAVSFLLSRSAGPGWLYDGDTVLCEGCLACQYCDHHGHTFPESWQLSLWLLGRYVRPRACTVCGICETEV